MFILQYWNSRQAEWLDCGVRSTDRDYVARRMRDDREACNDMFCFRIVSEEQLAAPADPVPF